MKSVMEEREIEFLVHFTRCRNLKNIFEYGLISREDLDEDEIESTYNDTYRLDGHEDAVCTSIAFPNYKMFFDLRCRNKDEDWAVLAIDASVLLESECAFCIDNAASTLERNRPMENKYGKNALSKLYDEYPNQVSRIFLGIDKDMTTNPQSEVLIFDDIEIDKIFGIAFESNHVKDKYIETLPEGIEIICNDYFFKWREDHQFWKKKKD